MIPGGAAYLVTPLAAWVAAGAMKFAINTVRARRLAWAEIGYGGLPSTHSAIVGSMAALVAMREGWQSAPFGVALTLAFIVVLDARGLRRHIGDHAASLNRLGAAGSGVALRERLGHSWFEIAAGLLVGVLVALLIHRLAA